MKNKLKLAGVIACLIAGICFGTNQKSELPALVLENIEALAYGEHGDGVNCYGDGSIDCAGDWVKVKISGLSLE